MKLEVKSALEGAGRKGLGTRIREYSENIPKPMVPIGHQSDSDAVDGCAGRPAEGRRCKSVTVKA